MHYKSHTATTRHTLQAGSHLHIVGVLYWGGLHPPTTASLQAGGLSQHAASHLHIVGIMYWGACIHPQQHHYRQVAFLSRKPHRS
jgi:hypothetical protein